MVNINKQIRDIIESDNIGDYLPEHLYHATFSGSLDSIKENGLGNFDGGYKSLWRLSYDKGVYLDTDEASAESFVEGSDDDRLDTEEIIIFKIPTDKLTKSLIEIDYNNDWNMDMLDEIEFESIEDYFSKVTYFYNGVIPFIDLVMVENMNEDKDNIEDEEVNLQPMSKEEVFKDVLETVKEKFEEYDITSKEEYLDVMLLPDGTALLPKLIKEEEDEDDSPTFGDYDLENFDFFLNDYGIEKEFPEFTGSIHFYTSHPEDESPFETHLNSKEPTQKQYDALKEFAKSFIPRSKNEEDNYIFFDIYKPNSNKVLIKINNSDKLINAIKRFYSTGVLKEDINHEEVYDSLTFSENPKRGPIFIADDGMFVNVGEDVAHSRIFGDEDEYEGEDYYILHDAYGLIKANSGNRIEPYPYIDIWKVPNPAQRDAIITWMYNLIEWGATNLMVNTSQNNEIYNLREMIPEDVYRDIIRNL